MATSRAVRKDVPATRAWFGACACVLAALALAACGQPATDDPEARLNATLTAAEHAAEQGDFDALAKLVADDYADRAGRDRRTLLLMVRGLLMRYPSMKLIVTVRELELTSPQLARVRLDVLAGGAGPAGLTADAFPLELSLRDDGSGWQVVRAEWGRRFRDGI